MESREIKIKAQIETQTHINYFQHVKGHVALPKELIIKIFLELLNQKHYSTRQLIRSVKDVVAFGTACKKTYNYYFDPRIWITAFKLFSHFKCNENLDINYYDIFKKNMAPIFNVYKNKSSVKLIKRNCAIFDLNETILICKKEKHCFIYNNYNLISEKEKHTTYNINRDLIEKIYLKRFIIYKNETNDFYNDIKIINFLHGKIYESELKGIKNRCSFQLNNTNINISTESSLQDFLCFGENLLLTLEEDSENKSQVNMKIFDMETAKLIKTKRNIINTSKKQTVHIFCNNFGSLPCLAYYDKEKMQTDVVIYELEKDIEYNYKKNVKILKDSDLFNIEPYIDSKYIAYIGEDNVITFIERETGNRNWIDLGEEKNSQEIIIELNKNGIVNYSCSIINDMFIYIDSKENKKIRLWNLQSGTDSLNFEYEMVISDNADSKISYATCNNHICICNEDESKEIFFNLQFEEKFRQEAHTRSFYINDHLRFINIPDNGYVPINRANEEIKIYDTDLDKIITLKPGSSFAPTIFQVEINSVWGNFLAISGKSKDAVLSISIFDLDTGESVSSISLDAFFKAKKWKVKDIQIAEIEWVGGLLSVVFDVVAEDDSMDSTYEEEGRVLYINFHNRFPFPDHIVDL